jgi:hypothetical protein
VLQLLQLKGLLPLRGLQTQIQQAQGELKMLNISITQKQPVITTLLKLKQNGVKDDDIIGLSKIIDLSRMGREWTPFEPRTGMSQNLEQGNGSELPSVKTGNGDNGSNNPGSSIGNNGEENEPQGPQIPGVNGLIKLNLKSTTTNMLNRMETSRPQ